LGWHLFICLERRSLKGKSEREEQKKQGKRVKRRDKPSSELISTVLTLVWTITGVWRGEERMRRVVKWRGAKWNPETRKEPKLLTGAHMSGDMLRTGESSLTDGAFVVASHGGWVKRRYSE